jgi:sulfonate transport system permease protein
LISVWFGMGDGGKIAFLALAAFFPLVLNTFEGVRSVPRELIELSRVLRFNQWQVWRRLVLPAAAPSILTGVQLALIYSWSACLGAEYLLQAGQGIGNLLQDGQEHYLMDLVLFGVVVVGAVGFAINRLARSLEGRLLRWRAGSQANFQ